MAVVLCLGCRRKIPASRKGRCAQCAAELERGRVAKRGDRYGAQHQAARARWAPIVAGGMVVCLRCDEPIKAGERWHLDHVNPYLTHPAHVACNTRHTSRTRHGG